MTDKTAFVIVVRLISFATCLSSAELLSHRHILRDEGLMSWQMGRLRRPWLIKGPIAQCLNYSLSYPNIIWLLIVRLVIAVIMTLGPSHLIVNFWFVVVSTALCWLAVLRTSYGQDGADQMSYIVYTGMAIAVSLGSDVAKEVFLWFVALQACLSYGVAGVAKAISKGWWNGSYLTGICCTHIYGSTGIGELLSHRRFLAKTLARMVIIWECFFPIVLLVPKPIALLILISGVSFHLMNGYVMGLNTFIWSFISTYPAILYCIARVK